MKRTLRSTLLFAAAVIWMAAPAFAQQTAASNGLHWYTTVIPWREGSLSAARV